MDDTAIREALTTKGVLASISIGCWSGHRLDKTLSAQQQAAAGATAQGALRVHKTLISDDRVKEPLRIAGEARRRHAELTLPWHYDGVGLLPADMVMRYDAEMGKLKSDFFAAVKEIEKAYPTMVLAAAQELGSAFSADDYPHIADLVGRYHWSIRFERLPSTATGDLRLQVPEEVVEVIEANLNREHEHLVETVVERMVETVSQVLDRLRARSKDSKARIYGSTIEKLNELPDIMRALNVTGNADIARVIDQLAESTITTDQAKNDAEVRDETIDRLATIQARLRQFAPAET